MAKITIISVKTGYRYRFSCNLVVILGKFLLLIVEFHPFACTKEEYLINTYRVRPTNRRSSAASEKEFSSSIFSKDQDKKK